MRKNKLLSGKWLLSKGRIYDPYQDRFLKGDLLVTNGKIEKIGSISNKGLNVIDCSGKIITSGFIDMRSHFKQPGSGYNETMETGVKAAMAGGYTTVCLMSDDEMPLDSPENIEHIAEKSANLPISILPVGSLSVNHEGKELCEFSQMVKKGAIAFSDNESPVHNSQFLRYALEYSKMNNVPVINYSRDDDLSTGGVVNESILSTKLGLKGFPDISEAIIVFRDLTIAEKVNAKIHLAMVSTKKSISIIRDFQKKGVQATADVTPHHIFFNENAISNYNSNAKVYPPLRSEEDRKEMIKAIRNKVVTCICSDHNPHSSEDKEKDIKHAPFGTVSLESAFSAIYTELSNNKFSISDIIKLFTQGPKEAMNLNVEMIEEGNNANLTVIDPDASWIFDESDIYSKSKNSIMIGEKIKGRIDLTISGKNAFGYF